VVADTIHQKDGSTVDGKLSVEQVTIATPDQGELVVPLASIRQISFDWDGVASAILVNDQVLRGDWVGGKVLIEQGLYSLSIPVEKIVRIVVEPRVEGVTLAQGTPVPLVLAHPLSSSSAKVGQEVLLCVSEDVLGTEKTAIRKGWPAIGTIAAAQGAAKMSRQGEFTVQPSYLLDPAGGRIPLVGSAEFDGGLNASNFVAAGVLGFMARGEEAKVPAGTPLVAGLAQQVEVSNLEAPRESTPAWELCREFYKFEGKTTIPMGEVDPQAYYAPSPPPSLTFSFPIENDRSFRTSAAGRFLIGDAYLHSIAGSVRRSRRKVDLSFVLLVTVLPSHDKRVTINLKLRDAEGELATNRVAFQAEEEKSTTRNVLLKNMDRERFDRMMQTGEGRLVITVNVRE
jgi:hypothetical protein